MEELLHEISSHIALAIEAIAVFVITFGALQAFVRALAPLAGLRKAAHGWRHELWARFGVWLVVGLEFMLAADIVRSAIAPTWDRIGQLAAIAAIRTFLNYFLEKDLDAYEARAAHAVE
jgi:uncharacterized membrane protein